MLSLPSAGKTAQKHLVRFFIICCRVSEILKKNLLALAGLNNLKKNKAVQILAPAWAKQHHVIPNKATFFLTFVNQKQPIMADTYTQIYYHVVFAVRNRKYMITKDIKDDLYKYMSGIINNQKQKLIIVNGMPDHVHILLQCKPDMNLSNTVKEIKEHSTKYLNNEKMLGGKFYWQAGFGAFSVSKRDVDMIINYIKNQEEHHTKNSFKNEYIRFLKENEIEFKDEYLFDFDLK
jgi:putative transposase